MQAKLAIDYCAQRAATFLVAQPYTHKEACFKEYNIANSLYAEEQSKGSAQVISLTNIIRFDEIKIIQLHSHY